MAKRVFDQMTPFSYSFIESRAVPHDFHSFLPNFIHSINSEGNRVRLEPFVQVCLQGLLTFPSLF